MSLKTVVSVHKTYEKVFGIFNLEIVLSAHVY